jgi:hypothetical protein
MQRIAAILLVGLLGMALLGCGPAGSAQPTASPSPTPRSSYNGPLPSAGAVGDLEALIPDTIAGVTISKSSMTGTDLMASSAADGIPRKFLEDLAVPPADVAVAVGFGFAADGSSGVYIFVFRAQGAGHEKLTSVFKSATDSLRATPLTWTAQSLGGKQVEVAQDSGSGAAIYLYATDDLLFEFSVTDPVAAADLIASFP